MNTRSLSILALLATGAIAAHAEDPKNFKTEKEKVNYAIGLNVGQNFKQGSIEYDAAAFEKGMLDAIAGTQGFTMQEARNVIMKYQSDRRAALGEKNKTEGEAFLAANKSKSGIKTTASGLQYKVLTAAKGETPKPTDEVTVKYRGTLIDGTEFDNSERAPGGTVKFFANQVIAGWTEALTNMAAGAKWQLFIPANLAYGEMGKGGNIAPNATLLFDVELVSFQAPPPPPAPAPPLTSDIIKVPSLEEMKKGAKIETIPAGDVEKLQKEKK